VYSVDIYSRVRRACLRDGMSAREAGRYFNKDRKTIAKMMKHAVPPGYQRSEVTRRPTLDAYVGTIDEILRNDKALIKKQRHTAKRIFERFAGRARTYGQPDHGDLLRSRTIAANQGGVCASGASCWPFVAGRAIVALDIGVLLGLPWLDMLDVNPHFLCPCLKFPTDVFWAIIRCPAMVCLQTMRGDPDYQRLAPPLYNSV